MTGLTEQAFIALRPAVEHAWLAYMEAHTREGHPRTSRRDSTSETSPLPTMADQLRFMLTSVKPHPSPERQGQLCGMSQAKAHQWIQRLHTGLNHA